MTTKVGDDYYMPLVLNWYGTTDNPFSDLLVTDFEQGANIAAAGIVIQKTTGDFNPMLDEFYQQAVYGFYSGHPDVQLLQLCNRLHLRCIRLLLQLVHRSLLL